MSQPSVVKKFAFSEPVDKEFIFSLYEHDYVYIAEVFHTSLESLESDMPCVETAFRHEDLEALKRAIHKLKPVFGFTGFLSHQEQVASLEQVIGASSTTEQIANQYYELLNVFSDARRLMETELKRLNAFISEL